MTLEQELLLSYYREVASIDDAHAVTLVQDVRSRQFYVKKQLQIYNPEIYAFLMAHPVRHTPRIYAMAEADGILTIIEEFIPGNTLRSLLDRQGVFPAGQVLDIVIQLCGILEVFHSCIPPIVNRDIKPSNIMLTGDGIVKLLDLNAAKRALEGAPQDTHLLGTQGYAAPEQYGFGASSVQTDIYALGILMRELLTGQLSEGAVVNPELQKIIRRCTELTPAHRYRSVSELRCALEALQQPVQPLKAAPGGWRRFLPPGFRSSNPVSWFFSLAGYALLLELCVTLKVENANPAQLLANRVTVTLVSLAILLFSGNYLDIQSRFPFARWKNPLLRLVGILCVDALILFCGLVLLSTVLSMLP